MPNTTVVHCALTPVRCLDGISFSPVRNSVNLIVYDIIQNKEADPGIILIEWILFVIQVVLHMDTEYLILINNLG